MLSVRNIKKENRTAKVRSSLMRASSQAIETLENRVMMTVIAGFSAQSLSGTTTFFGATTVDTSVSNTPTLTRDSGATAGSLSKGFSSSGFPAPGSAPNGGATTADIYFDITIKNGFVDSLSEFDLNYRSSASGPKNAELDYSLNGGSTFTPITTTLGGSGGFTADAAFHSITPLSLAGVSALQNLSAGTTVRFRVDPYGGTATTGTFAVYNNGNTNNDLAIQGTVATVAAVPTISSLSPTSGTTAGSNVTINGAGFTGATQVTFGGTVIPAASFVGGTNTDSVIVVTAPAHAAGAVSVTVTNATGPSAAATYTYTQAPIVTGITPTSGPLAAGTTVTITGSSFTGATGVNFGTSSATGVTVVNDSTITAVDPAGTAGTVDVTVISPTNGTSATSSADDFTYVAAPTVSAITPTTGLDGGNTSVTITGTGFVSGATVTFGGVAAKSVTVSSGTKIVAVSPAGTAGTSVSVVVSDVGGSATAGTQFSYTLTNIAAVIAAPSGTLVTVDSNPVITQVIELPETAQPNGSSGTETYSYYGFFIQDSTGSLEVFSKAYTGQTYIPTVGDTVSVSGTDSPYNGDPEIASVTAISKTGTATVPAPNVVSILTANSNPLPSNVAGYPVTIQGVEITSLGQTVFGTSTGIAPATGTLTDTSGNQMQVYYSVSSDETAFKNLGNTAVPTGLVNVTGFVNQFVSGSGTSATTTDQFNIFAISPNTVAPAVSSVIPVAGPVGGNNTVTINGYGFMGATGVSFGTGHAGTSITIVNDNQLTVVAPAESAGTVDVQVTGPTGTSTAVTKDHYSFTLAPVVSSLSPAGGPLAGGTTVTITGSNFASPATVSFGAAGAGTNVTVVSATTITVVSPGPTTAQSVDVTVTDGGSTSLTSAGDVYLYAAAPQVMSISPTSGLDSGGSTVTIMGSGFISGGSTVKFGTVAATSQAVLNSTTITAVDPAEAASTVDVTVTTTVGTSTTSTGDQFTFNPTTVAQVIAQPSGTLVTLDSAPVITEILSAPGTYNGYVISSYSFLVQDSTGSLDVFGKLPTGSTFVPVVGETISVSAKYSPYEAIPELATITAISSVGTAAVPTTGSLAVPATTTISSFSSLGSTAPASLQGRLVELDNVTITPPAGTTTFGTAQFAATITDSTGSMTLYYDPHNYSAANAFFYGLTIPTGPVDLIGINELFGTGTAAMNEFVPISEPGTFDTFSLSTNATPDITSSGPNNGYDESDNFSGITKGSSLTVTVTRSESTDNASIDYSLVSDSAIAGTDFTSSTGTLTGTLSFTTGQLTQTFTVNTNATPTLPGTKLFSIQLSNTQDQTGFIAVNSTPQTTIVINDPSSKDTVSENTQGENRTILPAGVSTTIGNTAINVRANNTTSGANKSFGIATFNERNIDPTDVVTDGDTLKTIDNIELETVNLPASFDTSGLLNVYITSTTVKGTNTTTYTPPSSLVFDATNAPIDGLGTQLGAKYLLGTISYNKSQSTSVYTAANLTNLDPTGVALLAADVSSGTAFTLAITPGDSVVAASLAGFTSSNNTQSPIIRIDYGTSLPAFVTATGTAATYIAPTKTLDVTGAATIVADPAASGYLPTIVDSTAGSIVSITPTTNPVDIHLGGINLSNGAEVIMTSVDASSVAAGTNAANHSTDHNVLVLGTVGNAVAPTLLVDAASKLDLTDNDLIVHSAANDDADGSGTSTELGIVQTLALKGENANATPTNPNIYDGTYTGNGLTSSAAATADGYNASTGVGAGDEQDVLAVGLNSDLYLESYENASGKVIGSGYNTLKVGGASENLAMNDVIVKYTYNGDLNLDGKVDGNAASIFSANYEAGALPYDFVNGFMDSEPGPGNSGEVDGNDANIFSAFFGNGDSTFNDGGGIGNGLPQL